MADFDGSGGSVVLRGDGIRIATRSRRVPVHRLSDYRLALTRPANAGGLTGIDNTQRADGIADGWNSR